MSWRSTATRGSSPCYELQADRAVRSRPGRAAQASCDVAAGMDATLVELLAAGLAVGECSGLVV